MGTLDELFLSKKDIPYITFTDCPRTYSFGQIYDLSDRLAYLFEKQGVTNRTKAIILINNCIEDVLAYFAMLKLGAIPILLDGNSSVSDVISISQQCDASIIVGGSRKDGFNETIQFSVNSLELLNTYKKYTFEMLEMSESIIACLCTSGSRGDHKIVKLLYKGWLESAYIFVELIKYNVDMRVLQMMPLFHGTGWFTTCILPLVSGTRIFVLENSLSRFFKIWDIVNDNKINYLVLMPSIMSTMLMINPEPVSNPIQYVNSSSDYLSPLLKMSFEKNFNLKIIEDYSSTEAGIISVTDLNCCNDSVGRLANISETIIDDTGEILVNTKDIFGGYFGWDKKDNWFHTGDIGYIKDDFLFLTGRKDDRININGEKFYPKTIDEIMMYSDLIQDSFTVYYNEKIITFVVLVDSQKEFVDGDINKLLKEFFFQRSGFSWCPYRFYIIDSLPLNTVGKVNKKALLSLICGE